MDINDISQIECVGDTSPGMDLDVPLFLMSKFCDSALKELSNTGNIISGNNEVSEDGNNSPETHQAQVISALPSSSTPFFAGIFSNPAAFPFRPRIQDKNSNSVTYPRHEPNIWDILKCSDLTQPESQQLCVERKLTLSKHIKSMKMSEFQNSANPLGLEESTLLDTSDFPEGILDDEMLDLLMIKPKVSGALHNVQERLESYLPTLTRRIANGRWSKTKTLPIKEGHLPADEVIVYYGIVDKPSAVSHKRLVKLFSHIGVAPLPLSSMRHGKKVIFLQDGRGRVELKDLTHEQSYHKLVPGIAIAAVGKVEFNCLLAEDIIFATPCNPYWPLKREDNIEMVFVSGLVFGKSDRSGPLSLFQDYLLGLSGSAYEQTEIISRMARLFIIGNCISHKTHKSCKYCFCESNNTLEQTIEKRDCRLGQLDEFLEPLLNSMEVFLLPGENEPTFTSSYPQPPLHPNLLPRSGRLPTLKRLTNPARISVIASEGVTPTSSQSSNNSLMQSSISELLKQDVCFLDVLVQSETHIKASMAYCEISCPFEMGLNLLKWGHLHPTYCDNSSPLAENLLRLHGPLPNLVVIGNAHEFKVVDFNGTKVVGVPSFQRTQTAVIFTKDFDVIPIAFRMM